MGTPAFAVASLHALREERFTISAVVTVTDKPSGRGQLLTMSPVAKYAAENGLRLLQPLSLRDPDFIKTLKEVNADVFVVVAFRMLPEEVWKIPGKGTFNLHASLLPQYRGAAPINHAILNGETHTGVTTFLIDREIDTGKILLSNSTEIGPCETAGELHDRLMEMGAGLVVDTVRGLCDGSMKPVSQEIPPGMILKPAPKIFPADTVINWGSDLFTIHNKIRGLSPYPAAVTTIRKGERTLKMKLFDARPTTSVTGLQPGLVSVTDRKRIFIACQGGSVEILSLQAEGRKRMSAEEFLRGTDISGWQAV